MVGGIKTITCLFLFQDGTQSYTIPINPLSLNSEAEAIQNLIIEKNINPYCLSFVIDNEKITYKAEYLKSIIDFKSRAHLIPQINMETIIKYNKAPTLDNRVRLRYLSEDEWIEKHASGTLRKNKRIGFTYRTQYLAERVAYEFGYGFQILPRSQITFGDPISEENCQSITEAGWHIERYMELDIFGDYVEAKYIHASFRDGYQKQGVGIIVRETSAAWIPPGHIVFSIIAEFNPYKKVWENAINPF